MLACGEQIRPVSMMASSVKQESRGFSHVRFNETSEKSIKYSKQRVVELNKKLKEFSDKIIELQNQKERISKDKSLKKCPDCENGVMSYNSYFHSYICDTCKRTES